MCRKLIHLIFFISMLGLAEGQAQDGYRLQPISGADGVFQTVIIDGVTVYRSFATRDSYHPTSDNPTCSTTIQCVRATNELMSK